MITLLVLTICLTMAIVLFLVCHFFKQGFNGSLTIKTAILKIFQFEFKITKKK